MPRDPLLAQIQIGRKQLNMEDDDYRAFLERVTGQRSAAKLTTAQRKVVIKEMKLMGFAPSGKYARHRPASSKPHVRYIFALWGELKRRGIWRDPSRASLLAFIEKRTGKADPEWLTSRDAGTVIEVLKAMGRG